MNYYEEIKEELINNEINKRVKDYSKNKYELKTYYDVGKLLIEAQGGETRAKYGNQLIKDYSIKLTSELGKGYSVTTLKYMRSFFLLVQKSQHIADQLSWSHYQVLLTLKDINKINYYIEQCIKYNLGRNELRNRIKSHEYERLSIETKEKLKYKETLQITDTIKNPIIIRNSLYIEKVSEKILQKLIIEDIENIMKQLGEGFCYIDKEYKIKLGKTYNYIDILLFNIKFNCYVVVELKVTCLKKEHLGQIQVYMNYVDENLKDINQNKTIGIIILKENDEYIIKYSSDQRIHTTSYILI